MPIADRIRAAIGEPLWASLGVKKTTTLESGTFYFDFEGSPSGGKRFWITVDDMGAEDVLKVQLLRLHGKSSRESLVQGKSGLVWSELSSAVRSLSRHGR